MHDILNRNLQYLERRSPALVKHLRGTSPDSSFELIAAESGDWTVKRYSRNGLYHFLHSKIDPRHEARMWTESQRIIMPFLVIIGIGLAYHVFELLKKCGNIEKAYLVEPDAGVFYTAMRIHDFSSLIQNASIQFFIGAPLSAIEKTLTTSLVQQFSCHVFSPLISAYPDMYNPVRELIEKHLCALRLREGDGIESLLKQMGTP